MDRVWPKRDIFLLSIDIHTFHIQFLLVINTLKAFGSSVTECWSTVYISLHNVLHVHQEVSLNSERFFTRRVHLYICGATADNVTFKIEIHQATVPSITQLVPKIIQICPRHSSFNTLSRVSTLVQNIDGLFHSPLLFVVDRYFPIKIRGL